MLCSMNLDFVIGGGWILAKGGFTGTVQYSVLLHSLELQLFVNSDGASCMYLQHTVWYGAVQLVL